jgi:hypothetical protein
VVVGTHAAGIVLPKLAEQLLLPAPSARRHCRPGGNARGGPPSLQGPDLDARHRSQDLRPDPDRSDR